MILNNLFKFIRLIPTEEVMFHWENAKRIMEHIDPEDVTFIAAALSQGDAVIWSEDKHFDKQKSLPILKTRDFVNLFYREF